MFRRFPFRFLPTATVSPSGYASAALMLFSAPLLFLGDGIQPVVDLAGTMAVFATLYASGIFSGGRRIVPVALAVTTAAVVAFSVFAVPFSVDPGLSFWALVRTAAFLLIFLAFLSPPQPVDAGTHASWVVTFGVFVALSAGVMRVAFPGGCPIPSMNLLCPAFGHNHMADIFLMVLPVLLVRYGRSGGAPAATAVLFAAAGIALSLSRGATAIAAAIIVASIVAWRRARIHGALVVLSFFAVTVATVLFVSPVQWMYSPGGGLRIEAKRQGPGGEARIEYWKQATRAFLDKPASGFGPGTFSLLSKRFQHRPLSYTWFAHNTLLQLAAEGGVIGLLVWGGLLLWVAAACVTVIRKEGASSDAAGLIYGLAAAAVYSLVEFNQSFFVTNVLFWSTAGVVGSLAVETGGTGIDIRRGAQALVALLVFYYVCSVTSLLLSSANQTKPYAAYVMPWHADAVADALDSPGRSVTERRGALQIAATVHGNNPDLMLLAAKALSGSDPTTSATLFRAGIATDPYNLEDRMAYVALVSKLGDRVAYVREAAAEARILTPTPVATPLDAMEASAGCQGALVYPPANALSMDHLRLYLSRVAYELGLSCLVQRPDLTRTLWLFSRDTNRTLSFYHAELAALLVHIFQDERAAIDTLRACADAPQPRTHCLELLEMEDGRLALPLPGAFKESIREH